MWPVQPLKVAGGDGAARLLEYAAVLEMVSWQLKLSWAVELSADLLGLAYIIYNYIRTHVITNT